ncbi:SDR family oxidoreductase [Aneurinibacillus sp. Ricciae_BoGa-3]|uniref:SDR family oxidoreductase n=1 Tax=Aneurinibacillus sp. Ricciae_BoGa-3 TaxID=3022697 RepID=UPI002340AF1B|nr:SDR family oxidoreductase [Aneurinibacillus sp. Ricciae_BoGa-3]WCK55487.1 SDR family oxidoreductase [Aneurinibacillus sp. Ricciae_BoGa-3]
MAAMENKTVIITGASSGIGQATAKELARLGMNVVLAARREEKLVRIQQEIEGSGYKAAIKTTDVTSRQQMEDLARFAVDTYGGIHVLVNNAGLMPLSFMRKLKVDEWDRMVDVNIKGVLYGIAAVLPHMEQQKEGHIINISSVAGHEVMPSSAVYSGTKFAVRAITEGLRKELPADLNIRSTIISPGAVATELTQHITDEDVKKMFSGQNGLIPLRSEDIAAAIRYAVEQPPSVSVNEIIVRPTTQNF